MAPNFSREGDHQMCIAIIDSGAYSPPYDISLADALTERGLSVRIYGPPELHRWHAEPDVLPNGIRSGGIRRNLVRLGKVLAHGVRMLRVTANAARRKVDLVHFQWIPLPALDYLFIRIIRLRVPVVFTMHNTSLFHGTTSRVRGLGLDACLRACDRVIVHSAYSFGRAVDTGVVQKERLALIPHGAFSHYGVLARHSNSPRVEGCVEFLFAGSIKPYKGLADLIEALAVIPNSLADGRWRVTIAGEPGMDVRDLQDRAAALGVGKNIQWKLRHQSERELAELLRAADVVVLPYREIDQSGVLMASVGVGKPVIATDVGAFGEIVTDGFNGLLVPPGDVRALGEAIALCISDSSQRAALSKGMQQLQEGDLSWGAVASRTEMMYRDLLVLRGAIRKKAAFT